MLHDVRSAMKVTVVGTCAALLGGCVALATGYLVNVNDVDVILEGHDVVALRTHGKVLVGAAEIRSRYNGATYYFTSEANRRLFDEAPEKYAPQFGAYCSMAMTKGMLEPAVVDTWSIVDGRLVVQRNEKAKMMWFEDPHRHLEQADANWPKVAVKAGKRG